MFNHLKGLIIRTRLFLMDGNLNNGASAGSSYRNLNNDLGNANWNIAARNCLIFLHSSLQTVSNTFCELQIIDRNNALPGILKYTCLSFMDKILTRDSGASNLLGKNTHGKTIGVIIAL